MYTKFYGLKERPFEISPDPKFLYLGENHREALAHLIYAVQAGKSFTVITGEVGTGKTTLVQTLLGRVDGNVRTAHVFNPKLSPVDFLHYICTDLGIPADPQMSKGQILSLLHSHLLDFYTKKEKVVLIIDEAQALNPGLLEEVRLLTNLETPKSKLLQVILLGQPELDQVLTDPNFRQLRQRISVRYRIAPLNRQETEAYIRHRLNAAGCRSRELFTPGALSLIYEYSKGIPRLVNVLCDNALLTGFATDRRIVDRKMVKEVIQALEGPPARVMSGLKLAVGAAALSVVIGILYYIIH